MKRISIVDDDPSVREALGEIVTTYGYEALVSGSAKDAVATLAKGGIHTMFLDLSMPEVTGD
jgi:CheY-like chemotaxis protein